MPNFASRPAGSLSPQPDLESVGDNYYISLSDLMVGMLFIFLILIAFFALQSRVYEQENEWLKQLAIESEQDRAQLIRAAEMQRALESRVRSLQEQLTNSDLLRAAILQRVQQELGARGVMVEIDEERGVLRLPQDALFDLGSAALRERGILAVQHLAEVFQAVLAEEPFRSRLESIYIEGHTDNVPIRTSNFRDNLSLSAARAMNTYQALVAHVPGLASCSNRQGQALFGISGYGELRPIGSNETESGRESNRRIDIRFVIAAPVISSSFR